ncbi:MAG: DNA-processing protein DprA [Acidiferrobacterales bacterium]|nr:DNA-processing protein DprA [Acidiferrobacterales bacterium]
MMEHWLRLIYMKGASLTQKRYLLEQLGSPELIFNAPQGLLLEILTKAGGKKFDLDQISRPPTLAISETVAADVELLERIGASFLPITDSRYPALLKSTEDAPLGLFCAGNISLLDLPQIAMVGSRHASRGGAETAQQFASVFCENNFVVTSGLALGIDTAAHQGALDVGGNTIAVVATGIDQIYPTRNRALHRAIVDRGLVVSEFPPQTPPRRAHFPSRNRIISGLSLTTLVVEAGFQSGSLITARLAAEQGREVFAIPGSIHMPGSKGCHYLLKQGAAIAESPEDVMEELRDPTTVCLHTTFQQTVTRAELNQSQEQLYSLLDFSPCPVDRLIDHSGLTADQVSSILMQLELQGLVTESIGGYQRLP